MILSFNFDSWAFTLIKVQCIKVYEGISVSRDAKISRDANHQLPCLKSCTMCTSAISASISEINCNTLSTLQKLLRKSYCQKIYLILIMICIICIKDLISMTSVKLNSIVFLFQPSKKKIISHNFNL